MCLCSRHWILAIICLNEGKIFIFKGKQQINNVFMTNLVITIVTNDDPFRNSEYKWYVSQGGQHSPKHKDEMHLRYRFPVLTYTSLYPTYLLNMHCHMY
jgi:hypothetical protein